MVRNWPSAPSRSPEVVSSTPRLNAARSSSALIFLSCCGAAESSAANPTTAASTRTPAAFTAALLLLALDVAQERRRGRDVLGVGRLEREVLLEAGGGVRELVLLEVARPEVVVGLRKVRVQLDRLLEGGDRLVVLVRVERGDAHLHRDRGAGRSGRAGDQRGRLLLLAAGVVEADQLDGGLGVVGLELE